VETVIYVRISQDRTGEELGVTRQREDCCKLAQVRGWTVVEEFTDNDVSASGKRHRPGFEAVLDAIEQGRARVVLAWDMTRLTRNSRDRLRLLDAGKKYGVTVAFVRGSDLDLGTPAGRLTADILGSVAQHEIEQKSDRQKRAVVQAAEAGRWVGGRRPFGYESDGVTIRDAEAAAVRAAYDAALAGVPLARIAAEWNASGLFTPQPRRDGTASPWSSQTVRPVLLNPRYAGLRSHVPESLRDSKKIDPRLARIEGIVGSAAWAGLVSEETYRAVVALLTNPMRRRPAHSGRGLLTGVALCGVCGATVHRGGATSPRGKGSYPMYRCSGSTGHVGRAAAPVEEYVSDVIIARLERPDAMDLLIDEKRPDTLALRREAQALRSRLDGLASLLAEGVLTEAGVRRESVKLRTKLQDVEAAQGRAGRLNILGDLVGAPNVRDAWDRYSVDRQRVVIETLAHIVLLPPGRGVRTFRPETVIIEPRR
jgi:site-specific DNA recombinase